MSARGVATPQLPVAPGSFGREAYARFLAGKAQLNTRDGFEPVWMPDFLFDFQRSLVEWALLQGRAAILADCGLGKTPMELVFAENVLRHTNKPVLIVAPLAVSQQIVQEGAKFGIECRRSTDGKAHRGVVTVTNYERLHHFNPDDFEAVLPDESSIIKSFDGALRKLVTDFMRKRRYRLLSTATAAPNDYVELGTSSEALGYLGHTDMLGRFFKNEQGKGAAARRSYGKAVQWRLRGHAEEAFWRWVCSWARAIRKPSDLGFDDRDFRLPPLIEREHVVGSATIPEGMLFALPAVTMEEHRAETRRTLRERCERVADLVNHDAPAVMWCNLNAEADLLERLVPGAQQVSGSMRDEEKEEVLQAFASGELKKLVTKPKITGFGLNWQFCAHTAVFPTHSYEQYYQVLRRFWRFGQRSTVNVDIVIPEGGRGQLNNIQKKAQRADAMFERLVALMNDALQVERGVEISTLAELPAWL